jgi:hypothetical protein
MLLKTLKAYLEGDGYTNVFIGGLPKQKGQFNTDAIVLKSRGYSNSPDIEAVESVGIRVYRQDIEQALLDARAIQELLAKSKTSGWFDLYETVWYYATITNGANIDDVNPNGNPEAYLTVDFNLIEKYLNK